MVDILNNAQLSELIEQCIKSVVGLVENELKQQLSDISMRFRTFSLPSIEDSYTSYFSSGIWRLILQNTASLQEDPDLVESIYSSLRSIGNILCFFRLLESSMEKKEINTFIQSSSFLDVNTVTRDKYENPKTNILIDIGEKCIF